MSDKPGLAARLNRSALGCLEWVAIVADVVARAHSVTVGELAWKVTCF